MNKSALGILAVLLSGLHRCGPRRVALQPPSVSDAVRDVARVKEVPKQLVRTAPSYPDSLLRARIQGRVIFRFVLDTLGAPEMGTFKIVSSPHEGLSEAVRAALPTWRYTPAWLGDHKVRVLLEQWVDFAVR